MQNEPGLIKVGNATYTEESFQIIVADATELLKQEHIRKIKEGLARNGSKCGRPPVSEDIRLRILQLKAEGFNIEDIARKLKKCRKTISKYYRADSKDSKDSKDITRGDKNEECKKNN